MMSDSRDELANELLTLCRGRYLSDGSYDELRRVVAGGSTRELEQLIFHLRYLPVVRVADVEVCEDSTRLLFERLANRARRQAPLRRRIAWTARMVARRVAHYELTLAGAEADLGKVVDRACAKRDLELGRDIHVLPAREAQQLAERTFTKVFRAEQKSVVG